jgi:ribonuclease HII
MTDEPGVAGCDEAGRGPLAGPVVCAAVVLPERHGIGGLRDSKALSASRRELLAAMVRERARWALAVVPPAEVDAMNVLAATLAGMARAIAALDPAPERAVVDGDRVPPGLGVPAEAWVRGDARHAAVAAASILAKTERDRLMRELDLDYPKYGFARHFGYPTPEHLAALRSHGPCPAHRRTFAPVVEAMAQGALPL